MWNSLSVKIILIFISFNSFGQKPDGRVAENVLSINLNDENYIRIYDGQVVDSGVVIDKFEILKHISISKAKDLDYGKPIMIVNSSKTEIENYIYQVLFSDKKFIETFKYPLDTRLPIVIDKVILTNNKETILSNLNINNIVSIKYLAVKQSYGIYKNAPFGVVLLKVKD